MKYLFSLLVLCLFSSTLLLGQDFDSSYISRMHYRNNFTLSQGSESNKLSFLSLASDDEFKLGNSKYVVSNSSSQGASLSYKWLSADLNYTQATSNERLKYNLNKISWRIGVSQRAWGVKTYYGDYRGLIRSDSINSFAVPDIRYRRAGARFYFVNNSRRFSLGAARFQTEQQKKTAGSLILFIEPGWTQINSNQLLISDSMSLFPYTQNQTGLRKVNSYKIDCMPGYTFTISLLGGRVFFSPLYAFGAGVNYNHYFAKGGIFNTLKYTINSYTDINLGYNGKRFFACLNVFNMSYINVLYPVYFQHNSSGFSVTVGYRFGDIETKLPNDPMEVWKNLQQKFYREDE
ncbi:MAG: hypothetical protein RL138_1382 [Bacteroidota bacterium]|nr:DUF4421 family protein [Chitinophagales bacterium]